MSSNFITRVNHEDAEPYTVIFKTDDADKYAHIEDECRVMIGHAKLFEQPTVDAVPVVRCKDCKHRFASDCAMRFDYAPFSDDWFCADGERKEQSDG